MSDKYFAFKNNGMAKKGSSWRNAPVRGMRNAFFEMSQEGSRGFIGMLYYQTADSDEWAEKWIRCHSGQSIYGKVKYNFVECTEEDFLEGTRAGFDITAKKQQERKEKASSVTYVGNKFIYSKHDEMMKPEKETYYLRNQLINYNQGYGGIRVRSFILDVLSETETLYKTKLHYLPTKTTEWKTKDKNFSKKKLKTAFGSGLIVETSDDVVAKYALISDEVPKKARKKEYKSPGEVYDSFDPKAKTIELGGKTFKVGTLLKTSDRPAEMGGYYTQYGVIKNITEKNVVVLCETYNNSVKTMLYPHEGFASYFGGRFYDFVNIHQDLRREPGLISELEEAKEDYENYRLIRNNGLREAFIKYNPDWITDK